MEELSNDESKVHLEKGTQSPPNLTDGEKHINEKLTNDIYLVPVKDA